MATNAIPLMALVFCDSTFQMEKGKILFPPSAPATVSWSPPEPVQKSLHYASLQLEAHLP